MGKREKDQDTSSEFGADSIPGNYNDPGAPRPQRTGRPQGRRRPPKQPITKVEHAMGE